MEVFKNTLISKLDYCLSNIYFKCLNIQLKQDVIAIPNFGFGKSNTQFVVDQREEDFDVNMNKYYLTKLRNILVFRDRYLLTKAHLTGIVVFLIKKENRMILGLDDGTEVVNCIMWTNDKKHKESDLQGFLREGNIKVGQSLTVLGQLEFYNGQVQLNIQKFKVIDDSKDEMHQFYYHTIQTQKRLFDPFTRPTPNPYYRELSYISSDNPNVLEEVIAVNKKHPEYLCENQHIVFTEADIEHEKEIERKNLEKIVCLNPEAVDTIIQNRTEGPLTAETIQYGYPNILAVSEEEIQSDVCYSKQVRFYNENVTIQKLSCSILKDIDQILSKVPSSDKKVKKLRGVVYDYYRLKLYNDFINNSMVKEKIEQEAQFAPEFKALGVKTIVMKCIDEFEKEGYIEKESQETAESIREDYLYFTDKRKDLYNSVYEQIKEAGGSGVKFDILYENIKSNFSKFYNKDFLFTAIDYLYGANQIIELEDQVYTAV